MNELTSASARPKAVTFNVREQTKRFLTPLYLHWAAIALLAAVNLYLLIALGVYWQKAASSDANAQAQQQMALKAAQLAELPLQGVDVKLATSNRQADKFYAERLPFSYSDIATELGTLARKDSVRLTRVGYSQEPVVELTSLAGQLTEVRLDASLQGDYRGLAQLINGMERDRMFFVITGVALTGQDSGRVNLRMRATTYIRGLSTDEEAQKAGTPISTADALADQAIANQGPAEGKAANAGGRR